MKAHRLQCVYAHAGCFCVAIFRRRNFKSVIEAMAHGLPIITTNVGGSPDLLPSGAGILVPPGDSAALANAMQCLASDPALRKQMGQAARERYLKLFAPDSVLSILVSTYSRLTGIDGREANSSIVRHPWATTSHQRS
jgi:Glycosyltransferase